MVNFRDPAVIMQDLFAVTKLWHALSGLYIWELLTTLDFEWNAIRGHRPYRWSIWIYSLTRLATLLAVIFIMIGIDVTTPYNCELQTAFQYIFGYTAFAAASFLIVLRNIAIWNGNKFVIAIAAGVWLANVGFLIQSIARIRATWDPLLTICIITNISSTNINLITTLVTDVVLLLIMLIGLLRLGFHEPGAYSLGRLMWRQGLIWLFLATIAEIPPVVFICLDLNDPLNYMFQVPAVITMSIASTRIYRSLVNSSSNDTDIASGFHLSGPTSGFKARRVTAQTISLGPMEVTVPGTYDESPTTIGQPVTSISSDGEMKEKPAGLGPDYDLERGAES